jgi:hypothetical protein
VGSHPVWSTATSGPVKALVGFDAAKKKTKETQTKKAKKRKGREQEAAKCGDDKKKTIKAKKTNKTRIQRKQ